MFVKKIWEIKHLVFSILVLIIFSLILYKIYIPRINEFGCFDDCNNFMGGYFLLHGKKLFSEIFFNHAPGMAYISFIIQKITEPINLYELILRHRQFVLIVGFLGNLLLFLRFRFKLLGVILIFELTKFYMFGDRFLAESIIIYPTFYIAGLAWNKINNKKLFLFDYILASVFCWIIIFTREPYIPLTFFLFTVVVLAKKIKNTQFLPIIILVVLSIAALFYHDISEMIFNVYTVNIANIILENNSTNILGLGIFKAIFYPFFTLFIGKATILRSILIVLSILFLLETAWFVKQKRYKLVLFVWTALMLANLRPVSPGTQFFEAFHMLLWFGLLLLFSLFFLFEMKIKKIYWNTLLGFYLIPILLLLNPKASYLFDKGDMNTSLITNYGIPMQVGNVVGALSTSNDTLFTDGFDDIIYWVAQRKSDYKYSWYTSLMPGHKKYTDARIAMFRKSPPDFYYGSCLPQEGKQRTLPLFIKKEYIRLNNSGKPSCLWIKKSKLSSITNLQWVKAEEQFYALPAKKL